MERFKEGDSADDVVLKGGLKPEELELQVAGLNEEELRWLAEESGGELWNGVLKVNGLRARRLLGAACPWLKLRRAVVEAVLYTKAGGKCELRSITPSFRKGLAP